MPAVAVPFADSANLGGAAVITGQTSRGGSHGPTNDGRVKPDLSTKASPSAAPTAPPGTAWWPAAVVRKRSARWHRGSSSSTCATTRRSSPGLGTTPPPSPLVPATMCGYGYVRLRGNGPPRTPLAPSKIREFLGRLFDSRFATEQARPTAPLPPNSAFSFAIPKGVLGSISNPVHSLVLNVTITNATGPGTCRCRRAGGGPGSDVGPQCRSAPARRWPTSWKCRSGPSAKSPSTPAVVGTSSSTSWVSPPPTTPTSSTR